MYSDENDKQASKADTCSRHVTKYTRVRQNEIEDRVTCSKPSPLFRNVTRLTNHANTDET